MPPPLPALSQGPGAAVEGARAASPPASKPRATWWHRALPAASDQRPSVGTVEKPIFHHYTGVVCQEEYPMDPDYKPPLGTIESPCVGTCCIGHDGVCFGCYRNRAELAAWGTASDAEKRAILVQCQRRQTP